MDVGGALLVGVDDHLVDELDDLVVGSGRSHVLRAFDEHSFVLVERAEYVADVAGITAEPAAAEELVERLVELAVGDYPVDDPALGIDVVDHLRSLDPLRVGGHDDDAVLAVLDRRPVIGLAEVAAHVLDEIGRLDAVCLERLVGHAEIGGKRLAQRRQLDLEFLDQNRLHVEVLAPRRALRELELFRRNDRVGDEPIVLGAHRHHALALAERDRERLAQLHHAFLHGRRERLPALEVDDLHHADQLFALALRHRRDQHLFRAVAGLGVDCLEEVQLRAVGLELHVVVDVADVDHALVAGDEPRDRLLVHRQLDVLERVQAGLHLGDDRSPVLACQVDRQPVGVEQAAQLLRQLEDDLVDVLRRMDPVRDRLQLLLEIQLLRQAVAADRLALQYAAHKSPDPFVTTPLAAVS